VFVAGREWDDRGGRSRSRARHNIRKKASTSSATRTGHRDWNTDASSNDQNNPNVHNELADLYLKTNQKPDAYDCFVRAVDEYTRVGLHNNAVAVCKKVLRVLPGRVEVFTKLGYIRARQGLAKSRSYYVSSWEKAAAGLFTPKCSRNSRSRSSRTPGFLACWSPGAGSSPCAQ
jgi:hypothetical protein